MSADKMFASLIAEMEERIYHRVMGELKTHQPEERRLSIVEAAEFLGVSPETVQRMCKQKQIPHIPLGAAGSKKPRVVFSSLTLFEYIRQKERESIS
ncbi:helix-turn-helix domain-containing protein [Cohnella luojiensis]|uniref:DNA-binding protein n=1 Tax=Cohnella luojiensis TaxID=652876 RepID=A0A4Y8MA21_9BACL|nr:helix-turn-helix domain-containing protein [Cohnella luojiensis]TFE30807.1 DNA-binding protein [Cohnella luojiensis]